MIEKDIELILIEGLFQTPETRIDFYLSKAKENNCTPDNFCTALYEAYKRLKKYVNSIDYNDGETDETTGIKKIILKTINLYYFTNGKHLGTLDNENIITLLPSLAEMTKQLIQIEKNKTPIKTDEAEKPAKTGFQSSLTDGQIQSLFDQLKGKYIDKNTNPSYFKASLKSNPLPDGFEPVKWLPGKNALRELLTLISGYMNKTNDPYLPDEAIKKIIPKLYTDKKGKEIALNKPKKGEYSNLYLKIEAIIKGL